MIVRLFAVAVLVAACARASALPAVELTAEKTDRGVTIKAGGELFTEYLTRSGAKPALWPLVGPTGKRVTRSYPLERVGEPDQDHPHQRSFWFTHGSVNGIDFWAEGRGHGTIEHREFRKVSSGQRAVVSTSNDWLGPDGKKICDDVRTLTFQVGEASRSVDFDIELRASAGPLTLGDTKEGAFGVRVASTMRQSAGRGKIVNSQGQRDGVAWGKRAAWVDYQGPVDGQVVGIAILNHPDSFRFPTWWHVRDYGLFAANPFGLKAFGEGQDGTHVVPAGESLRLRYRVLLHRGDEKQGRVAEAFAEYAKDGTHL